MEKNIVRVIRILFYCVFGLIPLIMYTRTSEIFEFNKLITTYILTILIIFLWLVRMIVAEKIVFKRTQLDVPILLFLGTQLLSTLISIDFRTSLLGYYSRFHGGFLSSVTYALLYWSFVSNASKKTVYKSIVSMFFAAFVISVYGILQHFGVDKHIWVQDVQERVFATLGQPNWMAAYLTMVLPLTVSAAGIGLIFRKKIRRGIPIFLTSGTISIVALIAILFTKSRSGLLGLIAAISVFFITTLLILIKNSRYRKSGVSVISGFVVTFLLTAFIVGTQWTPSLLKRLAPLAPTTETAVHVGSVLDSGGSDSVAIRKVVWQGAVDIWKAYPILGTGVETFAYSYYNFRPVEHNLLSEWDFLYNKAHNEYLNFLATTGFIGTTAYLLLLVVILWQLFKPSLQFITKNTVRNSTLTSHQFIAIILANSFLAGFVALLITNFFGFSVVTVTSLMFLFPALLTSLNSKPLPTVKKTLSASHLIGISIVFFAAAFLIYKTTQYWLADTKYALGRNLQKTGRLSESYNQLSRALQLSPNESLFWDELAQTVADTAILAAQSKETADKSASLADKALEYNTKAIRLSPANVNYLRSRSTILLKMSVINSEYLYEAIPTIETALKMAPTDAKFYYNLGLTHIRAGNTDKGLEILEKTINIKPNYREAHFAIALVHLEQDNKDKAVKHLLYIVEYINPDDTDANRELRELGITN